MKRKPGGLSAAHSAAYGAMREALLTLEHRGGQTPCHGRHE